MKNFCSSHTKEVSDMIPKIVTDYEPLNEYTTPLPGTPDYTNTGVIKAVGRYGEKYSVGRIEYQTFFNEEYQYIFTPYWDVIDGLGADVFQGIPGIKMELRLEKYYRVNMQPVFITERSPSKNREDLWELMASVGLDYYDRFEWLIRTPLTCGNDNLIVERYREKKEQFGYESGKDFVAKLQYGDVVRIDNQGAISENPSVYTEKLLRILGTGAVVEFEKEGLVIDMQQRSSVMSILRQQYYAMRLEQARHHQSAVSRAKNRGKYSGRKPIAVDEDQLIKVAELFHTKKITEKQAMARLGIGSRSTFYRRLKKLKG